MSNKSTKSMFFIILIGFLVALQPGSAQRAVPLKTDVAKEQLVADLESTIPDLMKKANIPGLTIAVVRDGKLLWTKGFGVKSTKINEPVTEDTIFEAASLIRPFFAYAAMKMVESGELSLDRPLLEYVPRDYLEKRYIEHSFDLEGFRGDWLRKITARMVLSHSSGLPPHAENGYRPLANDGQSYGFRPIIEGICFSAALATGAVSPRLSHPTIVGEHKS